MKNPFIIKQPLITEKATALSETGKYVFAVSDDATKNEIKKALKELYHVDSVKVNIIIHHPKQKSFRNRAGFRGGFKKAIVTLKEGQKIDLAR